MDTINYKVRSITQIILSMQKICNQIQLLKLSVGFTAQLQTLLLMVSAMTWVSFGIIQLSLSVEQFLKRIQIVGNTCWEVPMQKQVTLSGLAYSFHHLSVEREDGAWNTTTVQNIGEVSHTVKTQISVQNSQLAGMHMKLILLNL